jgi:hypothetical protein
MNGDHVAGSGAPAADCPSTTTPATNGTAAVTPQPAEVTVPVDPTLN